MTRHRDDARFYISAPQTFLNRPAPSIAEPDELVQTVTRLFETSRQQERALDALERHPGAADVIRQLDTATTDETHRRESAAALAEEREQTSPLRRGRRQELTEHRGRAEELAGLAHERIGRLHKKLDGLTVEEPSRLPALEPEVHPGPDVGPDLDMGW